MKLATYEWRGEVHVGLYADGKLFSLTHALSAAVSCRSWYVRRCDSQNALKSDCATQRFASYTSRRIATVCMMGKMPVLR